MTIPLDILAMVEARPWPSVRHSSLTTYEECPRKFFYKYRLGLTPRGDYSSALSVGDFLHQILRRVILGTPLETAFTQVETHVEQLKREFLDSVGSGNLLTGPAAADVVQTIDDDWAKARGMASVTLSLKPLNLAAYDVISVEKTLEFRYWPYPDFPPLSGTLDLVLRHKLDGTYWIVDYKTTSRNPLDRAYAGSFSPQLQIYRILLADHLKVDQDQIVGAVHYIIKKPGIKYCPLTKDKTGFQSYLDRIHDWYKEEAERGPSRLPVVESWTRFPPYPSYAGELSSRLNAVGYASRALDPEMFDFEMGEQFPRRGDYVCLAFNRVCPFLELCRTDPAGWPDLIRNRYDIVNPETQPTTGDPSDE